MIRLLPNHAKAIQRAREVTFHFDGIPVQGVAGETVVAALMRAGIMQLRRAPGGDGETDRGGPRGAFCLMGLCQECAVRIEGQSVEGCRALVAEGLRVEPVQ